MPGTPVQTCGPAAVRTSDQPRLADVITRHGLRTREADVKTVAVLNSNWWGKREGKKTRHPKKKSNRLVVRGRKRGKATQ